MNEAYDVAIVGYGPVGQLLAALLGQRGHRVVVLERYADFYPMPRAVHFDHEVGRILQAVGITADSHPIIAPYDDVYEWRNASGETLLRFDWSGPGPSWWSTSNFFSQPDLERALDAIVRKHANVEIRRGVTVVEVHDAGEQVTISTCLTDDPAVADTVQARYVVGCDGANSTVRAGLGIELHDQGFFFDWLIVDVIPHEPLTYDPPAWQLCDPKRPTTIVPGGPGRRRWEFMALPEEDVNELNSQQKAWELLSPWNVTADNAAIERHTVYRFQAAWAPEWRRGRVLLAGDAVHLMPPFAGQGMCAGMRDVVNLEWKLDQVLRGLQGEQLLDSVASERLPHVQHFIAMSMNLGQVICVTDEAAAAGRDAAMTAALADPSLGPPPPPEPRLGAGLVNNDDAAAGYAFIQSRVNRNGEQGLFDDVLGRAWTLLSDETLVPGRKTQNALEQLGIRHVTLGNDIVDVDGRYTEWLRSRSASAVLVRPDFYVYGVVDAEHSLETIVTGLQAQLATTSPN